MELNIGENFSKEQPGRVFIVLSSSFYLAQLLGIEARRRIRDRKRKNEKERKGGSESSDFSVLSNIFGISGARKNRPSRLIAKICVRFCRNTYNSGISEIELAGTGVARVDS